MNTQFFVNETLLPQLHKHIVGGSVFCCAFCGNENKTNHPIDKGFYEPQEQIKNFWTKKHRIYVCTNCIIKHNPHRCSGHPTKSILYIAKLTKGDKANMVRSLHLPPTDRYAKINPRQ